MPNDPTKRARPTHVYFGFESLQDQTEKLEELRAEIEKLDSERKRFKSARKRLRSHLRSQEIEMPPNAAAFLLRLFLGSNDRAAIPGDLEEEFTEMVQQFGLRPARVWFWTQTFGAILMRNPICKWLLVGGTIVRATEWIFRKIGN